MKTFHRLVSLLLCLSLLLPTFPANISAEFVPIENTSLNYINEIGEHPDLDTYYTEDSDSMVLPMTVEHPLQNNESIELLSTSETISGYCGGEGDGTNLTWTLDDTGTLTISGEGAMRDYDDAGSAASPWRRYNLRKLVLENGITTIGNNAFNSCRNLTGSLTIPEGVTTIGDHAFNYCDGLAGNFVLPSSVISIDEWAFSACSGLTGTLILPENLTTIGKGAFCDCDGFTGSLVILGSSTSISADQFLD